MFAYRNDTPSRIDFLYAGSPLLTFGWDEIRPYIHPLRTLQGRTLSDKSPPAHPWHLGLFFSWKYINGVNFWEFKNKGAVSVRNVEIAADSSSIVAVSRHSWVAVKEERELLEETQTLRLHGIDPDLSLYCLDFDHDFHAKDQDILLDRTEVTDRKPWGGYSGLSFRPAPALSGQVRVLNANRSLDRATNGESAKWAHLQGAWEQAPGEAAGLAMLDHPGNPRFPSPFFTMDASQDFCFLSASFIFHEPYPIRSGARLRLRYRVIVHDGLLGFEDVERLWDQYGSLK